MVLPRFMPYGRVDCRSIEYRFGVADGSRLAGVSSAGRQGQGCRGRRSLDCRNGFGHCRSHRICALCVVDVERGPVASRLAVSVARILFALPVNTTEDLLVEHAQKR